MPTRGRVCSPTRDLLIPFIRQPLRIFFVDIHRHAGELAIALIFLTCIDTVNIIMSFGIGAGDEGGRNKVTLRSARM